MSVSDLTIKELYALYTFKFEPGETVWFMKDDRITQSKVLKVGLFPVSSYKEALTLQDFVEGIKVAGIDSYISVDGVFDDYGKLLEYVEANVQVLG